MSIVYTKEVTDMSKILIPRIEPIDTRVWHPLNRFLGIRISTFESRFMDFHHNPSHRNSIVVRDRFREMKIAFAHLLYSSKYNGETVCVRELEKLEKLLPQLKRQTNSYMVYALKKNTRGKELLLVLFSNLFIEY